MFNEYPAFRATKACHMHCMEEPIQLSPQITLSSSISQRLKRSKGFDPKFRKRFHRAVCLRSTTTLEMLEDMYVEGYDDSDRIQEVFRPRLRSPKGLLKDLTFTDNVGDIDEVFHFLYKFLLPKLLTFDNGVGWAEGLHPSTPLNSICMEYTRFKKCHQVFLVYCA